MPLALRRTLYLFLGRLLILVYIPVPHRGVGQGALNSLSFSEHGADWQMQRSTICPSITSHQLILPIGKEKGRCRVSGQGCSSSRWQCSWA